MNNDPLTDRLDALFERLDAAELAPKTMLRSDNHKEHYESLLMFAFRKLQAARYHSQRVYELIETQNHHLSRLKESFPAMEGKMNITSATMRSTQSSREFTFELCAFFAAIRSGIDFLAMVCAQHVKGAKDASSMTTFLGMIKKGQKGQILDVIAEDRLWLEWLRDYRDYLVHRLAITVMTGGQVQWEEGTTTATVYPIVVPSKVPPHVPDTRRARGFDNPESRFSVATSQVRATDENGVQRLLEHTIEIEPIEGYIRIEELMDREVIAFERFFTMIVSVLITIDFSATTPAKSSP